MGGGKKNGMEKERAKKIYPPKRHILENTPRAASEKTTKNELARSKDKVKKTSLRSVSKLSPTAVKSLRRKPEAALKIKLITKRRVIFGSIFGIFVSPRLIGLGPRLGFQIPQLLKLSQKRPKAGN